jgi:hypothetical protein
MMRSLLEADEQRAKFLALQQHLIDHVKGGDIDVSLQPRLDPGLCLVIKCEDPPHAKVKITMEHGGYMLHMWHNNHWMATTGDADHDDFDSITYDVQSYTYGPQDLGD